MRSLLFVPGDSPRKQEKGLEVGADALILDLEDSVALAEKPKAREVAAGFLARMRGEAGRPKLYVRVNALDTGLTEDDLAAVMPHAPDGLMLPKAEGGFSVAHLGGRLAVYEAEAGLPDGATRILPIATETARAVFALHSLPDRARGSRASPGGRRTSPPISAPRPTGPRTAPGPRPSRSPAT